MNFKPDNLFGVVRRVVPPHGIKIGCSTQEIDRALTREQANALADALQAANPDEEYAVVQLVYVRWTKPQAGDK